MKTRGSSVTFFVSLLVACLGLGLGSNASANTIGIHDMFVGNPMHGGWFGRGDQYSVSCNGASCLGFNFVLSDSSAGVWQSDDSATAFLTLGSAHLNGGLLDEMLQDLGRPERVGHVEQRHVSGGGFTTSSQFFSVGLLGWTAFFENLSGADVSVNFGPNHLAQVSDYSVSVVPLPAAAPLFLSGLGLLGLFGWRNRKRAATA